MNKNKKNLLVWMLAFMPTMTIVGLSADINIDKANQYNKLNKVIENGEKVVFDSFINEKRIAYYIQKSGIKMDGSITQPKYFGKLPDEYKSIIIRIKDFDKDALKVYLRMKISKEEAIRFENELVEPYKFDLKRLSYQR